MNQSAQVYDMHSAIESLQPWLEQHLPTLDPVAHRRFVHLVTGILEQQSLLIKAIAAGSVFQATPESNFTQVQRIIRDTRLSRTGEHGLFRHFDDQGMFLSHPEYHYASMPSRVLH